MAKRFHSAFYTLGGTEFAVEVWDNAFTGDSIEFTLGAGGFQLHYGGEDKERTNPILGSELSFDMMIQDTDTEQLITDLAASAEGRFSVRVTQGPGGAAQYWVGRILSDISIYEDRTYPYKFTITATDGIAALKDIPYKNGGVAYNGDARLIEHIVNALNKLSHIGDFYTATDPFVCTAVDWWEDSMSSPGAAASDAMYQTWVNHATYYDYNNNGEKQYLSCYDVLESICQIFHARLVHMHGAYWIEQIPVKTASSFYVRKYDNTAAYVSNTSIPGVNDVVGTENGTRIATVQYDFYPPLYYVRVDQSVDNRRNFLAGQNIDQDYAGVTIYAPIDSNSGQTTMRLTGQLQVNITNDSYTGNTQDNLMLIFEIKIKVGTKYCLRQYEIQNFSINYDQAEWNTGTGSVVSYIVPIWPTPGAHLTTHYTVPINFTTPLLSGSSGSDYSAFDINLVGIKKYDGTGAFLGDFTTEWNLDNPWLEVMSYGNPALSEDTRTFYCFGNEDNTAAIKIKTIIGDSQNPNTVGRLKIGPNFATLTDASIWGAGSSTPSLDITQLLVKTVIDGQWTPTLRLNGIIAGDVYWYKPWRVDGVKYCFLGGTYTAASEEIDGQWFLLDYGTDGTPTSPIKKKKLSATIPDEGIYNTPGTNAGAGTGALVELIGKPPGTVLSPIKHASSDSVVSPGAITTVPINETLEAGDFVEDDEIVIFNPMTGFYETLTVTATNTAGATSIAVSGTLTGEYPQDSYILKKPLIGAFKLPGGTAQGQIIRWDHTAKRWKTYSGANDGYVLTWDTTNGWQEEAIPASATNLTFSGASSPVTLNSSTGTDVTITAGTGISFSQAANNLTITSTVTGTVTGPGTAGRFALWSSASNLTSYGQFQASRYNYASATPYSAVEFEGLQADPLSTAGPSEDAVAVFRAMTSGGTRALPSLAVGVWSNAAPAYGVWLQARSTGAFNTLYPILSQPRGGKFAVGRTSSVANSAWFSIQAGTATSSSGAGNYVAMFGSGETIARIGLGASDSPKSFVHSDGVNLIARLGILDSAATASVRFSVGSTETSDKVVIMPTSNGRLGAGFSSTTGLHSTLQSSGSFAGAILTPFAAPTIDETKYSLIWNTNSTVTFTLPSASACAGRVYWIFNKSNTGTINLSASISKGAGGTFNSLSAGQHARIQADDAGGWIGFKIASL